MHFKQMKRVGLTLAVFVVVGCGSGEPSEADKQEVVDQYAVVVFESYKESLETATQLDTKIRDFTAAPDSTKFQAAKDAWLVARNPYGQTEGYRFYGGPIDNEEDGPEGLINAWPLDENYIDYTRDANGAGLVNGTAPLTKELLVAQNEKDGEKNISTGYHAIEFLLWGQDAIDPANELPGQRPHTDYLDMASGGTAPNADRRSQ
ncbi:MAG: imelysin family protein, partial [Myxococcota bacterium]